MRNQDKSFLQMVEDKGLVSELKVDTGKKVWLSGFFILDVALGLSTIFLNPFVKNSGINVSNGIDGIIPMGNSVLINWIIYFVALGFHSYFFYRKVKENNVAGGLILNVPFFVGVLLLIFLKEKVLLVAGILMIVSGIAYQIYRLHLLSSVKKI